jgi:hypothetical protein
MSNKVKLNGKTATLDDINKELEVGDVVMVGKHWEFIVGWDS